MPSITEFLETVAGLPLPAILIAAAAFGVAESGLGIGMFVPGETVVLILAAATEDATALLALFVVVGFANSAGDHIGYLLGLRHGERLRRTYLGRRISAENWDRALAALLRYGAWAVFLTRLLPVVRTLTPATAGMAEVPYPRFLTASLAGSFMWSALYVFAGALAGASVTRVEQVIGDAGLIVLLVLAILAVAAVALRRRHKTRVSQ